MYNRASIRRTHSRYEFSRGPSIFNPPDRILSAWVGKLLYCYNIFAVPKMNFPVINGYYEVQVFHTTVWQYDTWHTWLVILNLWFRSRDSIPPPKIVFIKLGSSLRRATGGYYYEIIWSSLAPPSILSLFFLESEFSQFTINSSTK